MFHAITAFRALNRQFSTLMSCEPAEITKHMPVKDVKVTKKVNGIATVTSTLMEGVTFDGVRTQKNIIVDDENGKTFERVIVSNKNGFCVDTHINDNFTAFRCGVMTAVAINEACKLLEVRGADLAIGFIGNGNINLHNAWVINSALGISRCVVHGSRRDRAKNVELFPHAEVDYDCSKLNECDVIVSCTSDCDGQDMMSADILDKPKLFIALDTGYLLDESFRQTCDSFADYVPQLDKYYAEEFPFDKGKVKLKQLCRDRSLDTNRICVYLFGTGFADAVVAESIYKDRVRKIEAEVHSG